MKRTLLPMPIVAMLSLVGCGSDSSKADCLPGSTRCGDICVNLHEDQLNCGACGASCDAGNVCSAGVCAVTCLAGLDDCAGSCRDLHSDAVNCGTCGHACDPGQICGAGACQDWITPLAAPPSYGLADFTPAGSPVLLLADSSSVYSYSIADDLWSTEASSLSLPGSYSYPAWFGDNLFWIYDGSVYSYSITDGTAASVAVASMPANGTCTSQTTADTAGNLYSMADDGSIIQYNTATSVMTVFAGPTDLPTDGCEERLAWDSQTAKVYIADYYSLPFYSFDPASGTLTKLPDFPENDGMNDAFCSDRHGHIYTSSSGGVNGTILMFNTLTGAWSVAGYAPAVIGSSGNCTVTGDGYLYVGGEGSDVWMAAVKVF